MTGSLRISGLALLSALFFSLHNLGARVLAPDVPVLQSGVLASLATLTLCWLDLRFRHRSISLRPALPGLVALRSVLLAFALPAAFFGFSHLPQIEAYAIFFLEPLLVILLSMPLLKETIGPRRLGAMVVSFLGTLLVLGPTLSIPGPAHVMMVLAIGLGAGDILVLRHIGSRVPTPVMLFWGALAAGASFLLLLVLSRPDPVLSPLALTLPIAMGLVAWLAVQLLVRAIVIGPMIAVSPMSYSQVLFGLAFGILAFGDPVGMADLTGVLMIVGGGLFILFSQERGTHPRSPESSRSRTEVPS